MSHCCRWRKFFVQNNCKNACTRCKRCCASCKRCCASCKRCCASCKRGKERKKDSDDILLIGKEGGTMTEDSSTKANNSITDTNDSQAERPYNRKKQQAIGARTRKKDGSCDESVELEMVVVNSMKDEKNRKEEEKSQVQEKLQSKQENTSESPPPMGVIEQDRTFTEAEQVEVLPENETMWEKGFIVQVLKDDKYMVRHRKNFNGDYSYNMFKAQQIRLPTTKWKNNGPSQLDDIVKDVMEVLLDGPESNNNETSDRNTQSQPLNVMLAMCNTWCDTDLYSDLLYRDNPESFHMGADFFTSRMLGVNVMQFLYPNKYRWKVHCFWCYPSSQRRDPVWMVRDTVHHHLVTDTANNCYNNWIPRNKIKTAPVIIVQVFCDYCNVEMLEHDYSFRCSEYKHDICLKCFHTLYREHNNLLRILTDLLQRRLNSDCIFEIVCYTVGHILKFDT
ncbi:hypothetical protein RFI_14797 [Reticulomyxa filosa]|uniref:Uncharacterized protein n=1 Tax=Reticulomyxa filosa TaxID=46433 RepID=X6N9K2_RETFI|nr:hypothetical protein RFI_14797 [Reticulomyxa filosa]|eukprot:ETO22404.1 hypothetical protein RFI_14797 [Reticulomyxa filosa]